jgi:hypothetical protein
VLFILVGIAVMSLDKSVRARVSDVVGVPEHQVVPPPADLPPPEPALG